METNEVRIIDLAPMRMAAVNGYGPNPEELAFEKLRAFADPRGLMNGEAKIFGFNNPNPGPGSPNYGYELWIEVGPEVDLGGQAEAVDFPGGTYAVLRWDGRGDPGVTIPVAWQRLDTWHQHSSYRMGPGQCLEQHLPAGPGADNDFMLDLYLPIIRG